MTEEQEVKVRENRLRRMAERQGLRLEKSRRRDPHALGFGTYQLVDANTNALVAHGLPSTRAGAYGLTLDDVEQELLDDVEQELTSRRDN